MSRPTESNATTSSAVSNTKAHNVTSRLQLASNPQPRLLNPLLDSIFNSGSPKRGPLKQIVEVLAEEHNNYTILLPPTHILQSSFTAVSASQSTKTRLIDLCYSDEDFIKSHIIKTSQPLSSRLSSSSSFKNVSIVYNTLNAKQLLTKNGMIFPGKGFAKSLSIRITHIDYLSAMCTYFQPGTNFMIIHIEDTTMGSYTPPISVLCNPFVKLTMSLVWPHDRSGVSRPLATFATAKSEAKLRLDLVTFEKLLRLFPLLSRAVSDHFYRLFHHNNSQFEIVRLGVLNLDVVESEFNRILENAFDIVQGSLSSENPNSEAILELMNTVTKTYPGLDLNKLIHEYVELNLYDNIWSRIRHHFRQSDPSLYQKIARADLKYVSLNQLDVSVMKPWHMNELYKRINLAAAELTKLSDSAIVNLQTKTEILVETIKLLTTDTRERVGANIDELLVDADTLMGMLLMVIIHADVNDLEAHLYYTKHFNSSSVTDHGYLSYILSNFDAALLHLSSATDRENLASIALQNSRVWDAINAADVATVSQILSSVTHSDLRPNHFLKSRDINGESCLMKAIKSKNFQIYHMLMNTNSSWFLIDDILFDRNIQTHQSLLMCGINEGCQQISHHLIETIRASTTVEEQFAYYNLRDEFGRTIGHYLHNDIDLIDVLGPFLRWSLRDSQLYTPLFSLWRCYDHPRYTELIERSLRQAMRQQFDVDSHTDKHGNTLLHVIQGGLAKTRLLEIPSLDVNRFNHKNLSPLALYVKYNREENLQTILQDKRLDFLIEDPLNFLDVFDISSRRAPSNGNDSEAVDLILTRFFFKRAFRDTFDVGHNVLALYAKFDQSSKDWVVFFRQQGRPDGTFSAFRLPIEAISQSIYLMKLQYPISILPLKDQFFSNYPASTTTAVFPPFNKFKINRFTETLNTFLICLSHHPRYSSEGSIWQKLSLCETAAKCLTLDIIKDIKSHHDLEKNAVGAIRFDPAKILEIEFFLNFSTNDLLKFKAIASNLQRTLGLLERKGIDFKEIHDGFINNWTLRECNASSHQSNVTCSLAYRGHLQHITFMLLFVSELLVNISLTIDTIDTWRSVHAQIVECNADIRKYENTHVTNTVGHSDDSITGSASITSFFNLAGVIENKETKYKNLLFTRSELIKRLMSLNVLIKLEHEALAAEISTFLKSKSDLLKYSIAHCAREFVCASEQRKSQLAASLQRIKAMRRNLHSPTSTLSISNV